VEDYHCKREVVASTEKTNRATGGVMAGPCFLVHHLASGVELLNRGMLSDPNMEVNHLPQICVPSGLLLYVGLLVDTFHFVNIHNIRTMVVVQSRRLGIPRPGRWMACVNSNQDLSNFN